MNTSDRPPAQAAEVIERLEKRYPQAHIALTYQSPLEMLVATILSAQCTDKRVNEVTRSLFKKYHTIEDYANADPAQFEQEIRTTGFFRNKARNIINTARLIVDKFRGRVPSTMEELTSLPGVARKTANIVLFNTYGMNDGIAVDTHVRRLSQRLGLSNSGDPKKIEQDLMKQVPKEKWGDFSNLLIDHGRAVCVARKPRCDDCFLSDICPSAFGV